jgi:Ca2+-binding RTX toxin-like protein
VRGVEQGIRLKLPRALLITGTAGLIVIGVLSVPQGGEDAGGGPTTLARRNGCFQKKATHSGTSAADVIVGTAGSDTIRPRAGNDQVFGLSGRDRLCGAAGDDRLIGGDGFDRINGGPGFDHCEGEIERRCEG